MDEHTRPSDQTRAAEADDAQAHAEADELPTPDEEAAAERAGGIDEDVERNYKEAIERGADEKGEGRTP